MLAICSPTRFDPTSVGSSDVRCPQNYLSGCGLAGNEKKRRVSTRSTTSHQLLLRCRLTSVRPSNDAAGLQNKSVSEQAFVRPEKREDTRSTRAAHRSMHGWKEQPLSLLLLLRLLSRSLLYARCGRSCCQMLQRGKVSIRDFGLVRRHGPRVQSERKCSNRRYSLRLIPLHFPSPDAARGPALCGLCSPANPATTLASATAAAAAAAGLTHGVGISSTSRRDPDRCRRLSGH